MKKARVSIISAIGEKRELGKKNELIWRIPADLKRVKELTMGHPIIMGWNTYQSIGHPLPGRTNIVISWSPALLEGCVVSTSLDEALKTAHTLDTEEIFIFGGASVYKEGIPFTDRLYLTHIHATDPDADAFFPDYSEFKNVVAQEDHLEHTPPYSWITLEK